MQKKKGKKIRTISCVEAVQRMFESLDGMIKRFQKQELDEHMKVCRECCDRFEFEKLLKEKIAELSRTKAPQKLIRRIEKIIEKT